MFFSNLVETNYNYINKFDFFENYQYIQQKIYQSNTIQNSFAASDLVSIDREKIFSKLNIFLRISILPNSRPNSRSSQFIPEISRTIIQLFKQISILKNLLDRWSKNCPNLPETILDQIIKDYSVYCYTILYYLRKELRIYAQSTKRLSRNANFYTN